MERYLHGLFLSTVSKDLCSLYRPFDDLTQVIADLEGSPSVDFNDTGVYF
jgi:hypothetical protein